MQATIQGALGSAPLMLIQTRLKSKPDYDQYEQWGNMILHATAFSIILSAPVGLLVIALLGPISLKQACHALYSPHALLSQLAFCQVGNGAVVWSSALPAHSILMEELCF